MTTANTSTKSKSARARKGTPRKAPAKKTAKAKATTAKAAPEKKAETETTARPADAFTQRQVTNALKGLKPEQRIDLHKELLGVDVPRNTKDQVTMTAVKLSSLLAKTIKTGDGSLPEVVARALKPRRTSSARPKGPTRSQCIVRMFSRKEGATLDEVAAALIVEFPHNRRGDAATLGHSRAYASNALRHLRSGTHTVWPSAKFEDLGDNRFCMVSHGGKQ